MEERDPGKQQVELPAEALEPDAEPAELSAVNSPPAPEQSPASPETEDAEPAADGVEPGVTFTDSTPGQLYVDLDDASEPLDVALAFEAEQAEPGADLQTGTETTVKPEAETEHGSPAEAGVHEPDDGRQWYVIHCYSGYENKVRHAIEQRIETMGMRGQIFDVVVPTEEEIQVKDGKRRTVESRVFPGYILVQMTLSEESWYVVRNTPGVTGFVGMGNTPTPLRPEEVNQIIKRMEADAPKIKVTYKPGQKVRIIDGPFNDFIGTVGQIDMDRAKVRVMVSFFGRETPVELDLLQVEKT